MLGGCSLRRSPARPSLARRETPSFLPAGGCSRPRGGWAEVAALGVQPYSSHVQGACAASPRSFQTSQVLERQKYRADGISMDSLGLAFSCAENGHLTATRAVRLRRATTFAGAREVPAGPVLHGPSSLPPRKWQWKDAVNDRRPGLGARPATHRRRLSASDFHASDSSRRLFAPTARGGCDARRLHSAFLQNQVRGRRTTWRSGRATRHWLERFADRSDLRAQRNIKSAFTKHAQHFALSSDGFEADPEAARRQAGG